MSKILNHQRIEKKWQKIWQKAKIYEPDLKNAKKPFYNLMMFPYPSAEGLHVGNMYAFVGSDIYGRFKRMQRYDVFEPIGLDGFGIHSENYALKIGAHPMKQAKISEKRFYKQLQMIGNGFAWRNHLETYDPAYYKWTQWIFIQLFKNGLAYRKKQAVNWCPSCKTVLADEQVISGKCERCSSKVIKKELEQWFFRITKYAERLLKNLEKIDWSEKVKIAQRGWIGRSEGASIKFPILKTSDVPKLTSILRTSDVQNIEVFTTRPDTLFGATYLVLSPEHPLLEDSEKGIGKSIKNWKEVEKYIKKADSKTEEERIAEVGIKTGVELKGVMAINPATKKVIPVWVADYVLVSYGTGAIMAVPAHDERDFDFAQKYKLPIREVISGHPMSQKLKRGINIGTSDVQKIDKPYEGEGTLINSGKFNGMPSERARQEITKFVGGKKKIQYRLRDWLISRQRYWGPPIPMIYCKECANKRRGEQKEMPGWHSVPENQLPVKLPFVKNFRPKGKGESPLALVKSFYETKCPKCGREARRETDVSDTFLDSAWYYIGYLLLAENSKFKIQNSKFRALARRWLPVDMYIGGAEHAVLHLLYSRFLTMAFCDFGLLHFEEPFTKFRAHGLLISEGTKMSKSKGNIVVPDEYIKKFGADVLRMYLMFLAPFEQGGDFRDAGIIGIKRFLERVWKVFSNIRTSDVLTCDDQKLTAISGHRKSPYRRTSDVQKLKRLLHQTIKKVTEDIENLRYNTAISALMILFNEIEKQSGSSFIVHRSSLETFLKLLAPFAPHLTEELWNQLGNKTSIHLESSPKYNPALIKKEEIELVIQINGKIRDKFSAQINISQKEAERVALSRGKIKAWLKDKKIKKIIFVPRRLINIVV